MKTDDLIKALGRLKVQTGSLACLNCKYEDACGMHGCAIIREAAVRLSQYEYALEQVAKERDTVLAQLRCLGGCETCKNNQPSGEDDGHCTACMTGQRFKWNGGCRG